ncbi:MAG: GGDEF domain-containing protein, partial [Burkholderiales bacterium]
PNRRSLQEFLQREWLRATRRQSSLAVVMIDLDHFKRINDSYGHEAGDVVLIEIAALLKAHVRGSDAACRFGGEEFVLVLPDAGIDGVKRRADGIREAIARLQITFQGRPLGRISASLGVALFPDHAADPEALLRASDLAMYEAKRAGRDRVVVSRFKVAPVSST